jgi:hypothetical protein
MCACLSNAEFPLLCGGALWGAQYASRHDRGLAFGLYLNVMQAFYQGVRRVQACVCRCGVYDTTVQRGSWSYSTLVLQLRLHG